MLDSSGYLKSYNWKEGEALQKGGIKKPILVKHKKDKKGIGHQVNGSADAWWERLFDGQLKGLDVKQDGGDVSFKQEKVIVASAVPIHESPLYRMFVRGETLQGTTGKIVISKSKVETTQVDITKIKTEFSSTTVDTRGNVAKKEKKDGKQKKVKKSDKAIKKKSIKDKEKKSSKKSSKAKSEEKDKLKTGVDIHIDDKSIKKSTKEKKDKNKASDKKEENGKKEKKKEKKHEKAKIDKKKEKESKKRSRLGDEDEKAAKKKKKSTK